jgi:hypothetical protein
MRDLCVMRLSPLSRDMLEARYGRDVDPTEVSDPCVTHAHR